MSAAAAPVVEMLWEATAPHEALAERFGLRDAEVAARWVAARLAEHWSIETQTCRRLVISDHNALAWVDTPSDRYVAKWSVASDTFPRLHELARLTRWLCDRGLPVSAPVLRRDGRTQVDVEGASIGLQREIAGQLLDPADPERVRAAGAALAGPHLALTEYAEVDRLPVPAMADTPLPERMLRGLDSYLAHVPARARDALHRAVDDARPRSCRCSWCTATLGPPTSCAPAPASSRSSTSKGRGATIASSTSLGRR